MLILHNGNIITCDPEIPYAEALAIHKGRFIAVGRNEDILAFSDRTAQKQNLIGRTVIPGITDAHIHLEEMAFALDKINCETATKAECLSRVKSVAEHTPPGRWIQGHGWNHNAWDDCLPTASELDKVAPHNPVYLIGKSLHIAWSNNLVLQAARIDANTTDPRGGKVERDIHGVPSGILMDSAILLVQNVIPLPEIEESITPIMKAQSALFEMGITSIHNFDTLHAYQVFTHLHSAHELKIRIVQSIPYLSLEEVIENHWRTGSGDDWLKIGPLKLFADGALGSKTASMLKPYTGSKDESGIVILFEKELVEIGCKAIEHGISLAVQAIGDRANRTMINTFESLCQFEKDSGLKPIPLRIEHMQLIDPSDLPRLSKIGIIASMQPIHATSDAAMADRLWGDRCSSAYAWKSILNTGARLIFGSDATVENPNPFWGIHAAVTRLQRGTSSLAWYPEQCLTFYQALKAFTINPAIVAGQSDNFGTLRIGCYADLAILSANPALTPPKELYNIKANSVMIAGNWILQ